MQRSLGALLLAILLPCCSSEEAVPPGAAPAGEPAAAEPLDPAGLEALVVEDAPTGFTLSADESGATGPTDLDAAAEDTSDPAAAAALADAGFLRGYQRLWISGDDEDELFLLVYEFEAPAGARAFFERVAGGAVDGGGQGVFDVPGMPDAVGVAADGDGLAVRAVSFTTGPYLVQVIGNGPEPGPSQGTVVALAAAQAQRLA